jgi:hypothetical protein
LLGVAAITALVGVLSTALLISVLTQKLQLSRSEKYVHNFVLKIELSKQHKSQAANIVKFALRVWYLKRKSNRSSTRYITAQRRLLRSILISQQIKQEQRKLIDNCVGVPELLNIQRETNDKSQENADRLITMQLKVDQIEEKLVNINQTMMNIENSLHLVLDKMK